MNETEDGAAGHRSGDRVAGPRAAEELQRRREEIGFSDVVVGPAFADALAPVVAELAGRKAARPADP